jgi:hypothetical protein
MEGAFAQRVGSVKGRYAGDGLEKPRRRNSVRSTALTPENQPTAHEQGSDDGYPAEIEAGERKCPGG